MKKHFFLILTLFTTVQLFAIKHEVTSAADDYSNPTAGMLRYWILNASDGDTIVFSVSTVSLDTSLRINGGVLTIDGGSGVVLDVNNNGRVFNISSYSYDDIVIRNLTIKNGQVEGSTAMGGGMYAYVFSGDLLVENCTFINNSVISDSDGQGGALRTNGGVFQNCYFLNNEVTGTTSVLGGGGIQATGGTFINCVVAGNKASYGGGVYASGSTNMYNCTITQNEALTANAGGGVGTEGSCSFVNCIIYNNQSNGSEDNIDNYLNQSSVSYCALENGNSIVGSYNNIGLTTTPFVHSGIDSLNITSDAECKDMGTISGITVLSKDITGNKRVSESSIDIGAYEYNPPRYDSIIVTNQSSDPNIANSLPWAINHADSAGIITFNTNCHIQLTEEMMLSENITIDGSGYEIILDGQGSTRIFNISNAKYDTLTLKNLILRNAYSVYGGSVIGGYTNSNNVVVLENCLFDNNHTSNSAGAISIYESLRAFNCTFVNNSSNNNGGAAYVNEDGIFVNCLFYGNSANDELNEIGGNVTCYNSAANGYLAGENNVYLWNSPFVGGSGSDSLHLSENSYCSNAGTTDYSGWDVPEFDLAGNQRILQDTIDIGAFESNYQTTADRELFKTIVVSNNSTDASIAYSLPWALSHADDSCVITFNNDFTINISNEIICGNQNLTIDAEDNLIILDGGEKTRAFKYVGKPDKTVNLIGLTIQNCRATFGGGISADRTAGGNLFVTNCVLQNNYAQSQGGGMYVLPGISYTEGVTITGCAFLSNEAKSRGGGLYLDINTFGSAFKGSYIFNCTFKDNSANGSGGVYSQGNAQYINCLFYHNPSTYDRDVRLINGSEASYSAADVTLRGENNIKLYLNPFIDGGIQLTENSFCNNAGNQDTTGYGLLAVDLFGNPRIVNDTIDIGAAESVYSSTPKLELFDNLVVQNNSFDPSVENSLLWAIMRIKDGGIITFNNDYLINTSHQIPLGEKSLTIDGGEQRIILDGGDSTKIILIEGNDYNHTIKINNITFQRGYNEGEGGAVHRDIFAYARLELLNCMFYNNTARYGGGLYLEGNSSAKNCVFIENHATYMGGGAFVSRTSKLINCSIFANTAYQGAGGVHTYDAHITNTVIYGNTSTYNQNEISVGYNNPICTNSACGDNLQAYGEGNILLTENPFEGTTLYDSLNLKTGSVLINKGTPNTNDLGLPRNDFNGNNRIVGDTIDIGAYEYFDHTITYTTLLNDETIIKQLGVIDGSDKQIKIDDITGYKLDSLWADGVFVDSTTSYTFRNLTTSHTLKAKYSIDSFRIVVITGENGRVTPADTSITFLDTLSFSISSDTGYKIDTAIFADTSIINYLEKSGENYIFTITNQLQNDTLRISYAKELFNIRTEVSGSGSVNPADADITYFDTLMFSITPNTGYSIGKISFSGEDVTNSLIEKDGFFTYTIDSILSNDTLKIEFIADTFHIITKIEGNGMITPNSPDITYDETITFQITPGNGYELDQVIFGGIDEMNQVIPYGQYFTYRIRNILSDDTLLVRFVEIEQTNNISETPFTVFKVYPNPANDHLNIDMIENEIISECIVRIYAATGELVHENTINNRKHRIDLSKHPEGIYILRIIDPKKNYIENKTLIINK